jgi:acyl-CoA synthetase (NDP forming)
MLGSVDGPLRPGSRIPGFAFPEQAAAALGRVAAYSQWRRDEAGDDPVAPARIDAAAAGELVGRHVEAGTMPPGDIRRLLAAYGVAMAPTELVGADEAVGAADRVGYPVAVKALRRRVGRSAEAGVALDLSDADDVAEAVAIMRRHLGDDAERVFVQPMITPGVDLRVRITVDDRIGPVITVGLGGVQADAIADESSRLAPVSPSAARSMVAGTRAASLLDDDELEGVVDVVTKVAQLGSDHPELYELDLNPLIVSESGCYVADATVVLRAPERPEPATRRLE